MYYKIFKTGLASQLEYRINFITSFLFSLIPFAANALLWIAAAHQNKRMTVNINGIISYYFVILIVSNITSTSSVAEISEDIRLGGLNKHLLKPYNYASYKLVLELPKRFIFIVMNFIPLMLIYIFLNKYIELKLSAVKILCFILLSISGYLINFLFDFFISLCGFYFSKVASLYNSIRVIKNIFSGAVFPLMLLPDSVFKFLTILPFAYINYFPADVLLNEVFLNVITGRAIKSFVWILVLTLICMLLWKKGLRKYSAYGG